MAPKSKHNWQLTRVEAAHLLRNLADTLEDGSDEVADFGISLAELVKFKIKIDLGVEDALEVKFTGKGAKICQCQDGASCGSSMVFESYSGLKKRMQVYFKALRESVARGELPSREIVSVFIADSEKMTGYHGYGDEFYPAYAALAVRLREAFDSDNLAETAKVVAELAQAKKDCHARYK